MQLHPIFKAGRRLPSCVLFVITSISESGSKLNYGGMYRALGQTFSLRQTVGATAL